MRTLAVLLLLMAACSTYAGSARDVSPRTLDEPGWIAVRDVPLERQQSESDCGAAAIAMLVGYWTGVAPAQLAADLRPAPERGIKAGRLRDFARAHGLASFLLHGELADLTHELESGRPVLVGLAKPQRRGVLTHYEVVVALHAQRRVVVTLDPDRGWRQNSLDGFLAEWQPTGRLTLIVSAEAHAHGMRARQR